MLYIVISPVVCGHIDFRGERAEHVVEQNAAEPFLIVCHPLFSAHFKIYLKFTAAVVLQKKHLPHIVLQIARFVFPAGRHQRRFGYVAADVALVFGEAQRVKSATTFCTSQAYSSAIRICRCSVKIRPKWYMPPTDRMPTIDNTPSISIMLRPAAEHLPAATAAAGRFGR